MKYVCYELPYIPGIVLAELQWLSSLDLEPSVPPSHPLDQTTSRKGQPFHAQTCSPSLAVPPTRQLPHRIFPSVPPVLPDNGKQEKNNEGGEKKLTDRRDKRDIIVISLTRTDEQIGKYDSYLL